MNTVHFMSEKNNWETPQELFDALHAEFGFTLDAAASDENHKLPRYYTAETDGLSQDWGGSVCSVTLPTETRKRAYGLRNAGKKLRNRTPWWCFLSRQEQTVLLSTISSISNPMLKSASCEVDCGLKTVGKRWGQLHSHPCCAFLGA